GTGVFSWKTGGAGIVGNFFAINVPSFSRIDFPRFYCIKSWQHLIAPAFTHIYTILFRFQAPFLTPCEDSVSITSVKKQIFPPRRGAQH
ncbi:MAG TPA: hypothetical protein DEV72_12440, partial [Ktedonobacter sp.]|nr:hypothetical protein [Ktedonobacter sp.]